MQKKGVNWEQVRVKVITSKLKNNIKSQLWDEGTISSSFFPLKISMATKWHFACPCLPVFEVETSTTCFNLGKKCKNKQIMNTKTANMNHLHRNKESSAFLLTEWTADIIIVPRECLFNKRNEHRIYNSFLSWKRLYTPSSFSKA